MASGILKEDSHIHHTLLKGDYMGWGVEAFPETGITLVS